MAVIVINKYPNEPKSELPLFSIAAEVDSGYVMEKIVAHTGGRLSVSDNHQYPGRPENPEDFTIGGHHFLKKDGKWFLEALYGETYTVVYGGKALDDYGSGEMFKQLLQATHAA